MELAVSKFLEYFVFEVCFQKKMAMGQPLLLDLMDLVAGRKVQTSSFEHIRDGESKVHMQIPPHIDCYAIY